MIEVIRGFLDMTAKFINEIFLFQVEWDGQMIPIGKIYLAGSFIIISLYLILDSFGLIGGEE